MRSNNIVKQMLKQVDWILLAIIAVILVIGVLSIASTVNPGYDPDEYTFWEYVNSIDLSESWMQIVYFGVSLIMLALLLIIDYNNLKEYSDIIYWITVAMLVAVLFSARK